MILYIVSLSRSTLRREAVLRNPFGSIQHQFFDAFDGAAAEHEKVSRYDEGQAVRHFGLPLTSGEIACFASHYALWELSARSQQPLAIMEDDVEFSSRFREAFDLANRAVVEHHFIRLAAQQKRPFSVLRQLDERYRLIRFRKGPAGTQCYCVSPTGARALLAGAQLWREPVDVYLDSFWRHGLTPKAIVPFEAREMDRRLVQSTIGDRRFRRTALNKLRHEILRVGKILARLTFNAVHRDK